MNKKVGYSIIAGLVLLYGLFIFVQLINNNVDLISKTSPIGALVATLISVIMAIVLNTDTKNDQNKKIEDSVRIETIRQINSFRNLEYQQEIKKLQYILEQTRLIYDVGQDIQIALYKEIESDVLLEKVVNMNREYSYLSTKTTDMLDSPELRDDVLADYAKLFYEIRPKTRMGDREEIRTWFEKFVYPNQNIYSKKMHRFSNEGLLIQILISITRRPVEEMDFQVKNISKFGIKKLNAEDRHKLFEIISDQNKFLTSIRFVLDAASVSRIRHLKNYISNNVKDPIG